jgi:hypothetical protein
MLGKEQRNIHSGSLRRIARMEKFSLACVNQPDSRLSPSESIKLVTNPCGVTVCLAFKKHPLFLLTPPAPFFFSPHPDRRYVSQICAYKDESSRATRVPFEGLQFCYSHPFRIWSPPFGYLAGC